MTEHTWFWSWRESSWRTMREARWSRPCPVCGENRLWLVGGRPDHGRWWCAQDDSGGSA